MSSGSVSLSMRRQQRIDECSAAIAKNAREQKEKVKVLTAVDRRRREVECIVEIAKSELETIKAQLALPVEKRSFEPLSKTREGGYERQTADFLENYRNALKAERSLEQGTKEFRPLSLPEEQRRELFELFKTALAGVIETYKRDVPFRPDNLDRFQTEVANQLRDKTTTIDSLKDNKDKAAEDLICLVDSATKLQEKKKKLFTDQTPLDVWEATEFGNLEYIKAQVKQLSWSQRKSTLINGVNAEGMTMLHLACVHGHAPVVKFLSENGANVEAANADKDRPLHLASKQGSVEVVELLIVKRADVNAQGAFGRTPLSRAAHNGKSAVLQVLLRHKADPNIPTTHEDSCLSPLHSSVFKDDVPGATVLIDYPTTKMDLKDIQNRTPLYYAVLEGLDQMVELIVNHPRWQNCPEATDFQSMQGLLRIDPRRNKEKIKALLTSFKGPAKKHAQIKSTDIWMACEFGDKEFVEKAILNLGVLASKSTFVNQQNKKRETLLYRATDGGHFDVVELLLKNGAKTDIPDQKGVYPLHLAAKSGNSPIVSLMLSGGTMVDVRDASGQTPLLLAAVGGWSQVVLLLMQHKADVNRAHIDTKTQKTESSPLHQVVFTNDISTMRVLMAAPDLDVNTRDKYECTAFRRAIEEGRLDLAVLIVTHSSWKPCLDPKDPNHLDHLARITPKRPSAGIQHLLDSLGAKKGAVEESKTGEPSAPPSPPKEPPSSFTVDGVKYTICHTTGDGACALHALLGVKSQQIYTYQGDAGRDFVAILTKNFEDVKDQWETTLIDMLQPYLRNKSSPYEQMIFNKVDSKIIADLKAEIAKINQREELMKIVQEGGFEDAWSIKDEKIKKELSDLFQLTPAQTAEMAIDPIFRNKVFRIAPDRVMVILKGTEVGQLLKTCSEELTKYQKAREQAFLKTVQLPALWNAYIAACQEPGYYFSDQEIGLAALLFRKKARIYSGANLSVSSEYGREGELIVIYHRGNHYSRCDVYTK